MIFEYQGKQRTSCRFFVTLEKSLFKRIEESANRAGLTKSNFLQMLLSEHLGNLDRPKIINFGSGEDEVSN